MYAQELITRLHERAESYRQSGPSAEHAAALLDEAAGAISTITDDPYPDVVKELAEAEAHAERLLSALKGLNAALDAYWNLPLNGTTNGTLKRIEAAQQASKVAIEKAEAWK